MKAEERGGGRVENETGGGGGGVKCREEVGRKTRVLGGGWS